MLLYGKPLAETIKITLTQKVNHYFPDKRHYVAILFFWDNNSSATYVKHKQAYAKEIWLETIVFWQKWYKNWPFPHLLRFQEQTYDRADKILKLISHLNQDEYCIGIMIQLPLPPYLAKVKYKLLQAIEETKDIDGLGGSLVGKSFFEMLDFTPATPKAVLWLLDYYNLGNLKGKNVAIIGQSTIVWKPLALECLKRGAIVQCFDIKNTTQEIQNWCQRADLIFSGTGAIHLINEHHLRANKDQIVIDIGYGHLNGKPVGDVDFVAIQNKVAHITPVPGGIGPLTIAALFSNTISLREHYH